ncbi:MAG: alpha-2-macroglobulin family protein, partial [Rhodobacteraceae bacterium]|nr:alpha-2-macroglobulin family protein [Paracoccaceae bacterium]
IRTTYQWYHSYGNWEWEPLTRRSPVTGGEITLGTGPIEISAPVDWGQYELVVETTKGDYIASSTDFYAGWYVPADTTKTPDTLELSLDKPAYKPGETAMLRVVPRFAGTALVSVMSNRLIAMQAVEVSEGENLIPVPVTDDWGTGAYVTASVIRPANAEAGQNPSRALGLAHASIDPGAKQLAVALDAPEITAPRGPLDVKVKVDGGAPGETAYVTLAAVDLGILNMTGFDAPDPSEHYFGQRRLGMEIRDIYGRLIDGLSGEMGALRSGGDAASGASFQSPPPTEELVAYFEGPVAIGPDGTATVSFDMPEFNGTVRLMAIAWTPSAVGQADTDVIVRDPVVVTASVPRFLAPGDQSRLLLEMTHVEGPSGRMGLDVSGSGVTLAGNVPSGLTLDKGATERLSIPVTATEVGDHTLRIALTTPDGRQLVKSLTLPVRANDPEISTTQRLTLAAGDSFTLDDNLFANLRPGTGSAVVSAGPIARFDAPGLLRTLDRYPYGCTEQITSKTLPLLYFNAVSSALGMGDDARVQKRIDDAISVILTRQSSNGAFGLWRAGSGDFWLDAYVSDFLSRARAKGYTVPDRAFRTALDNLRNRVNYAADFDKGGEDVAYALMVLAREGAANMGDLRYYADVKAVALATPLAAAQIGAALAFYGDQTRADRMFAQAARMMDGRMQDAASPLWRADYGTNLRDTAGLLTLAVEAGSDRIDRDALSARIGSANRALSTQESVWSLMAAHALIADESTQSLTVNGTPQDGPLIRSYESAMALDPLAIRNNSARDTYLTVTALGVPDYPLASGGYGYKITRSYFTPEGK